MIICFVGPANSSHIVKWCTWFTNRKHEVHVISFTEGKIPNTKVYVIDTGVSAGNSDFAKIGYLFSAKRIRKIIDEIKPDIVNAHYATSYGMALALSGVKDYVLSVWGSDVYDFPNKSFLHKAMLKYSLRQATHLFSTSKAMADEASKYTNKKFEITPFGVDINLFNPNKRTRLANDGKFIVGTVKSLSDNYGIRYLLQAVAGIYKQGIIPIELRIAGKGSQEHEYRKLAKDLGISSITHWLGFISQEEAANEWANMDIAIVPSLRESFGVAAVEAQACGTAIIVSDVSGLMEATKPGETSIVVKQKDADSIAKAIEFLFKDSQKRKKMGDRGVCFVKDMYEMNYCFTKIETIFNNYSQNKY